MNTRASSSTFTERDASHTSSHLQPARRTTTTGPSLPSKPCLQLTTSLYTPKAGEKGQSTSHRSKLLSPQHTPLSKSFSTKRVTSSCMALLRKIQARIHTKTTRPPSMSRHLHAHLLSIRTRRMTRRFLMRTGATLRWRMRVSWIWAASVPSMLRWSMKSLRCELAQR